MASLWASTAASPSAATARASSSAVLTNCGDLATKSLSDFNSTRAATLSTRATATAPSTLSRPARSAALPSPRSRSQAAASTGSPSVASSAFLASIIPAPVASRSAFTSWAVNSAMALSSTPLWS